MVKEVNPGKPLSFGKNKKINSDNIYLNWNEIDWTNVEIHVLKLQMQIYKLSKEGEKEKMWERQRILTKSYYAKLISVRKVTQDNRGRSTPGVDGVTVLNPNERLLLANKLTLNGKASSIKRVFIPKPDTEELRPLGIPTIKDRAKQQLAKLALEPEWEAKFEPNSYGCRPSKSCHDAIGAIYTSINRKPKYVLDVDINKCFDNIDHDQLLKKIDTYPAMKRQIAAWLKAEVLEDGALRRTRGSAPRESESGTFRPLRVLCRTVISPLLANIALDGLERMLDEWIKGILGAPQETRGVPLKNLKGRSLSIKEKQCSLTVVRYADDIVILHPLLDIILLIREQLEIWLSKLGLTLKKEKTRTCHTLYSYNNVSPGFNFLGFHILQHPVGKYRRGKKGLAFKTIITPSGKNMKNHLEDTKEVLQRVKSTSKVISEMNPKISGWSQYFKHVVSKKHFSKCDYILGRQLFRWARRKHPTRVFKWCLRRYFIRVGNRKLFGFFKKGKLVPMRVHSDTPIQRHVKISSMGIGNTGQVDMENATLEAIR